MDEFDLVTKIIHDKADENAVIIVGMVIREDLEDSLKVMIIATVWRVAPARLPPETLRDKGQVAEEIPSD